MAVTLTHERRTSPRISAVASLGIERARLRPGRSAWVINVSCGGALLETEWRLLPGARVDLQLGDPTIVFRVSGRIVRCHVSRLERGRIRYRGALEFEKPIPVGEVSTQAQAASPKT